MDPLFAVLAPPAATRVRDRLGVGADAPVELATTGWCKLVALFDEVAVLVPRHHHVVDALRREIETLHLLSGIGLPAAPRVLEVIEDDSISPYPLAVVERVPGRSLEDVEPAMDDATWASTLRSLGHAVSLVHRADVAALPDRARASHRSVLHGLLDRDGGVRSSTLHDVAGVLDVPSVDEAIGSHLAEAASMESVIVHNDLHEAQIMVDGRGAVTGIVDWQTASIDHPFVEFDLLQWGRGALARFGSDLAAVRAMLCSGAGGEGRHGRGMGERLELAWTLNDGWWAATNETAPVTGLDLGVDVRASLVRRARRVLHP